MSSQGQFVRSGNLNKSSRLGAGDVIARVPYLNSAPFFRGLSVPASFELIDKPPRQAGARAAAGDLFAGLLPLADFLRLKGSFDRLGPFGIAVRGRARSVLLFSRKPVRQLEGSVISVTEDTSTSAVLLRLILEQRYDLAPSAYARVGAPANGGSAKEVPMHESGSAARVGAPQPASQGGVDEGSVDARSVSTHRGHYPDADALLLIGDEALRFRQTNALYPFEIDLGFEWWLWQHLPCVFAVWAITKHAPADEKRTLELAITQSFGRNQHQLEVIAQEHSTRLGIPAADLHSYLSSFIYRLSQPEEEAIKQFYNLAETHHLL